MKTLLLSLLLFVSRCYTYEHVTNRELAKHGVEPTRELEKAFERLRHASTAVGLEADDLRLSVLEEKIKNNDSPGQIFAFQVLDDLDVAISEIYAQTLSSEESIGFYGPKFHNTFEDIRSEVEERRRRRTLDRSFEEARMKKILGHEALKRVFAHEDSIENRIDALESYVMLKYTAYLYEQECDEEYTHLQTDLEKVEDTNYIQGAIDTLRKRIFGCSHPELMHVIEEAESRGTNAEIDLDVLFGRKKEQELNEQDLDMEHDLDVIISDISLEYSEKDLLDFSNLIQEQTSFSLAFVSYDKECANFKVLYEGEWKNTNGNDIDTMLLAFGFEKDTQVVYYGNQLSDPENSCIVKIAGKRNHILLTHKTRFMQNIMEKFQEVTRGMSRRRLIQSKDKTRMNIAWIGHIGSGKSTTLGHFIYKLGGIDRRTIDKFEEEGDALGKGRVKYAWVLDKLEEERNRGNSITVATWKLETEKYRVTTIDTPGHADFIKNAITGMSMADAAVMIVSAAKGEFEEGMSYDKTTHKKGKTKEHMLLAKAMGAKELIVAVNKMDHTEPTPFSQDRFEEIKTAILEFAESTGYSPKSVVVVPISGWFGDNLVEASDNLHWYKGWTTTKKQDKETITSSGTTFLEAINALLPPKRPDDRPLRMPIFDVYKVGGIGTVMVGDIAFGIMKPGDTLKISPAGFTVTTKSIEIHHESQGVIKAGMIVGVNVEMPDVGAVIKRGDVAGSAFNDPPKATVSFAGLLMVMNVPNEIHSGYTPVFDVGTAHVSCKITSIDAKLDKRGRTEEEFPDAIRNGDSARITVVPRKPMCVEAFNDYSALGRFVIRDNSLVVGVGVIQSVTKYDY